ncbi:hypothetical protein PYR77_13060 [Acinetobacter soli]|nr:hypothetical protein [Acinetobacter soli]WEH96908.1 hypothetical protein PYR76_10595 [Acinetobacter soli]WEI00168.1 hypothetical protein PYR77_13060 [Acinetobacter soli]
MTGYFLISILFGNEFLDSYKILVILSFGLAAVFYGILIGGQVMLNIGLDKDFVKIQLIVSILSVSASLIILPFGGAVTIALIWTLSEIIITAYQIFILKRKGVSVFDFNQLKIQSIKNAFKYMVAK